MSWLSLAVAAQLAATPLTLEEARTASRRNLSALRAELDVQRAQAGTKVARAAIYPSVDVTAGASEYLSGPQRVYTTYPKQNADGTTGFDQIPVDVPSQARSSFSLGVTATQLLYDGGKWWTQVAQAQSQEAAAQGQLDEQRLASELEAVRRFYELVRAQLTLRVLEASVDRSQAQLDRAQSLYEAARVQRRDVLDADVNLGNDRISVLRQKQQIQSAGVDLLQWLGQPWSEVQAVEPKALAASSAGSTVPAVDRALAAAKKQRPLIASLQRSLDGARQAVDVNRADYLPKVSASASLMRQGANADPFFTDPTKQNAASIGVNVGWNVFRGFSTDAQLDRARADVTQAEAQQRQSLSELEGEVARTLKALEALVAVAALADRNLGLASEQLKLEEERYAAGAGSSLDVRNAQIKVTQAQLTQLTGRIDVEIARAMLQRTVGGDVEGAP